MSKSKALIIAALALGVTSGVNAQQQQPAPPQLPQAPNMTFFVIGAGPGKGADLGGIEGADQHCQMLAQRHGAGGKTWRAYLSTQEAAGKPAVNARDRIGNGPWQDFKGQVLATSVDDLHSDNNKLGFDTSLSERGQIIPGVGFAPNRHDVLKIGRAHVELQSHSDLVCRLLLEKKKKTLLRVCWHMSNKKSKGEKLNNTTK